MDLMELEVGSGRVVGGLGKCQELKEPIDV